MIFLGYQEFSIEGAKTYPTVWWFRIPATLMFGLVILVFALECLMQEMTVRRWATSVLVFAVFGILFVAVGIFNPQTLHLPRGVLIPLGVLYLVAAGLAGSGARDVL
jgi:peptidoglycan/LPS O-acetylase OafA/YrhL